MVYIYNLGYVLLVKSICISGLYSTLPISSEIFRIKLHEVTCEISESIGRDCSCIHSKRGFFSNICKRLLVWLYFDGKCGLIRQTYIHNDYQLYTVNEYRVREYTNL